MITGNGTSIAFWIVLYLKIGFRNVYTFLNGFQISFERLKNCIVTHSLSEIVKCLWHLLVRTLRVSWRLHFNRFPAIFLNNLVKPLTGNAPPPLAFRLETPHEKQSTYSNRNNKWRAMTLVGVPAAVAAAAALDAVTGIFNGRQLATPRGNKIKKVKTPSFGKSSYVIAWFYYRTKVITVQTCIGNNQSNMLSTVANPTGQTTNWKILKKNRSKIAISHRHSPYGRRCYNQSQNWPYTSHTLSPFK